MLGKIREETEEVAEAITSGDHDRVAVESVIDALTDEDVETVIDPRAVQPETKIQEERT